MSAFAIELLDAASGGTCADCPAPAALVMHRGLWTPPERVCRPCAEKRLDAACTCEGEVVDGVWVRRYCPACRERES